MVAPPWLFPTTFFSRVEPARRSAAKPTDRQPTWDEEKNPEGRWRSFSYDDVVARDKASLDIFWLRDESLEDSANLPDPHILAEEIADDLRSSLEQIESVLEDLQARAARLGGT